MISKFLKQRLHQAYKSNASITQSGIDYMNSLLENKTFQTPESMLKTELRILEKTLELQTQNHILALGRTKARGSFFSIFPEKVEFYGLQNNDLEYITEFNPQNDSNNKSKQKQKDIDDFFDTLRELSQSFETKKIITGDLQGFSFYGLSTDQELSKSHIPYKSLSQPIIQQIKKAPSQYEILTFQELFK